MSNPLSRTLYDHLVSNKDTGDNTNRQNREKWYHLSYDSFLCQNIATEKDLFKAIAFAYSWMPTIPKLNVSNDFNWSEIIAMIQRFQAGNELEGREELLEVLVPIINQSVVGTSKVLHFFAPDKVPIIDSRVLATWNKVVPSAWQLGSLKTTMKQQICVYIQYWDYMNEWLAEINGNSESGNSDITLRDLELALFQYAE